MTTTVRIFALSTIIALLLSACSLFSDPGGTNPIQPTPLPTPIPDLSMSVTYDTNVTYNAVGQVVTYSYLIGNTSGAPIPGPVTVIDDRVTSITCPDLTLVGDNRDNNLDTNEALSCTGTYTITQLDLNAGSFANTATASASGKNSSAITTTVTLVQTRALTLAKTADPTAYNSAGENIIYSYVITNSGNVTLGPVQFTVTDDKIGAGAAFNCGGDATILDPNGTVSCSATYITTAADLTAGLVTNSASASDGTTISGPITTTINSPLSGGIQLTPDPNLVLHSTISHTVVKGEWLWQIARCYGANPEQVVNANRGRVSDPAKLVAGMIVTVPNIGSERTLYGPQKGDDLISSCAPSHTIQSGDTWASIADDYKASQSILQSVNPGVALSPGNVVRVPFNSAGNP